MTCAARTDNSIMRQFAHGDDGAVEDRGEERVFFPLMPSVVRAEVAVGGERHRLRQYAAICAKPLVFA